MAFRCAVYSTLLLCLLPAGSACGQGKDEPLLTVAEKSNWTATSKHAEVIEFCEKLSKASPRVGYSEYGRSGEDRPLVMLTLADPPVKTPEEARQSGKAIVLVFANIHAGEVDGKEGVMMLARDLALAKDSPLFKDVVVLIVPDLNPDGNDRFGQNRRGQNGPTQGMGTRANARGLDLNRDFVKVESPEIAGLIRIVDQWDPHIIVDCHTTNGSYHRHVITYDTCKHPACDSRILKLANDKMIPELTERLEKKGGWKSFYYGNFNRDKTLWETYGHEPRYSTQYCALRNRIGILSESYSYAPYKDRILASKDFVNVILDYAAAHKDELRRTLAEVDETVKSGKGPVALQAKIVPLPGRYTILGYEEKSVNGGRPKPTEVNKDYPVTYVGGVEPTLSVERAAEYLIPAKYSTAIDNLKRHGIHVETLPQEQEMTVEVNHVTKFRKARGEFQKHLMDLPLETEVKTEKRKVPAGTFVVKTTQKLGTLAAFLLEPRSEDGLTTWNYFDDGLAEGQDHPVLRVTRGK